jgi:predicted transcriptional regulator
MIIMSDKILVLLRDSKWHELDEISKEIPLSTRQIEDIVYFLQEQSLINYENLKLKITKKGLRFLELPV